MDSLSIAHRAEDANCERLTVGSRWHCVLGVVAVRVRFLRWRLGFRQFSFRPIVRALQGNTFNAFQCSPLLRQAVFPSGFRFQVGRKAHKSSSELLVTASRIQHRVTQRTLAPHPARAFTNAPCGARSLLSVFLAPGSVDDSWHASTPSCQPCQNRLDCARSDGGSGSLPLLSAAVDRKPCIVPVVPSISTRSDCDLRAFGSVANPSVLPGTAPTSDRRG